MRNLSSKIEKEQSCAEMMIRIYCNGNHGPVPAPCPTCTSLLHEARRLIEHCVKNQRKTNCLKCKSSCFSEKSTMKLRQVIRYSRFRLIFSSPLTALRHWLCTSSLVRYFSLILGVLAIFIGTIGIVVPGLPTTPFVLLAAFFFARSSERFHEWLCNHRIFGSIVRNWERDRSLPRRAKYISLAALGITGGISLIFISGTVPKVSLLLIVSLVALFLSSLPVVKE